MLSKRILCSGLVAFSLGSFALAQAPKDSPTPYGPVVQVQAPAPDMTPQPTSPGLPSSTDTDIAPPLPEEKPEKLGPTNPEDVKLFMSTRPGKFLESLGIRGYGWVDSGYTFSSSGPGVMAVETRENLFGNSYIVNEIAMVLDKPLDPSRLSFGFNSTLYAGSDAALLHPLGGIDTHDPRMGLDFRNLFVAVHLPVLTEGGLDIRAGRMGTVIGYESALAPYRPFYSNDYQWFYAEDGAFTGVLGTLHVTKRLDVVSGITFGANTFFTMRGTAPCYLGQINYWLQDEKRTLLSSSVYVGNNAIFAAPGMTGTFDTNVEVRVQHKWTERIEQIVQSDMGWSSNVPNVGTAAWYSLYTIGVVHLMKRADFNVRGEWFDDVGGSRTGINTNFSEATVGFDLHPFKAISIRPEVRGDFSGTPAFNHGTQRSQLTAAVDFLGKF